jgi:hypothetical protein
LRDEAQHLIASWCWISGDPNPSNWGTRADGSLVLFDWELVRRGTPPTDLAILVSGLGDEAKYAEMAACYLTIWPAIDGRRSWPAATLARDIALAKVWTVVMLLRASSLYRRGFDRSHADQFRQYDSKRGEEH